MSSVQDILSRLQTAAAKLNPFMVIYGPEGSGKTTLASQIPRNLADVVFIVGENDPGIIDLVSREAIDPVAHFVVKSWEDLRAMTNFLLTHEGAAKYRFAAFDQLTSFQNLLMTHTLGVKFDNDTEKFTSYAKGLETALIEWESWINDLTRLRARMTVLALGHAVTTRFDSPEGNGWQRWVLDLITMKQGNKLIDFAAPLKKQCSEMAFIRPLVVEAKGKGKGGNIRELFMNHSAAWDGKNRWGIDTKIDLGMDPNAMGALFRAAIQEAVAERKAARAAAAGGK